jgi:hypothetical protein
MTPAALEAAVGRHLDDLEAGKATRDQACAAILADCSETAAWWIEQAYRGARIDLSGRTMWEPGGARDAS